VTGGPSFTEVLELRLLWAQARIMGFHCLMSRAEPDWIKWGLWL